MFRYVDECNAILRNLSQELRSKCPAEDQYCCYLHCCFVNRQHKEVWETWYFWLGVTLIALLMVTSGASFVVGMCSRKRHQLIRVHHHQGHPEAGAAGAVTGAATAPVTAATGPDGLIQPYVAGVGGLPAEVAARYKTQGTASAIAIFRGDSGDGISLEAEAAEAGGAVGHPHGEEDVAGPLEPAYPPMQPVTIVRGPLPEGGFRQTDTYTELVLPPGYVDPQLSHKQRP